MDSNEQGMINSEGLVKLHNDKGDTVNFHPVDAKEALETGKWYKDPQEKKKAAAEPEKTEKPAEKANDPGKDDSGVRMSYMAKDYIKLKNMATEVGLEFAGNVSKEKLVDMLIEAIEK
jgi:hypothetical protein